MPVMGHLRELRNRIVKAALAIGLGTVLGIVFFGPIWAVVTHPFCSAVISGHSGCKAQGDQFVVNGIFDPFMVRVQVAFFAGLIATSPVWLYQLWAFIAPGLCARERRWTYLFVGAAVPLFAGGAALAYLVMSRGLAYLLNLTPHGVMVLPTISTYLGYFQGMILGFGVTFELPLALIILNLARILTHARFRKWRRPMIFGAFLFAGIAKPSPDPISMLLLDAPACCSWRSPRSSCGRTTAGAPASPTLTPASPTMNSHRSEWTMILRLFPAAAASLRNYQDKNRDCDESDFGQMVRR